MTSATRQVYTVSKSTIGFSGPWLVCQLAPGILLSHLVFPSDEDDESPDCILGGGTL